MNKEDSRQCTRRRFLQWIACAPAALTFERLSAFAISPHRLEPSIELAFEQMRIAGLPGAVIGISAKDRTRQVWALGSANHAATIPVRRDHVFRIGSVAKAIVGHVMLRAIDESLLGADDPMSKWISGFARGDEITIDMLARHRSGLANPIADPTFRARLNREPTRHVTSAELLDYLRETDRHGEPNASFSYSNANTVVLGKILEEATGTGMNQLIKRWLLPDNGLDRPCIPADAALPQPELRGYRFGPEGGGFEYGKHFFDATRFSASWAGAGGNMNATIDDLLSLARPLASCEDLSDSACQARLTFDTVAPGFEYGFHITRLRGTLIGHSGDVPGFSSFMALDTLADTSIAVLCNLSNFANKSSPARELGLMVAELLGQDN